MTKEITKANIIQEVQDKLGLREFDPATFLFDETVVPVYDIEQHLQVWKVAFLDVSITAGPAGYYYFKVPATGKWLLRGYNIVFMAAGAYTVTGLYVLRTTGGAGAIIYLDMKEGQTVSYAVNLPSPVPLGPGDVIYLYVDSYTSTANLRLYIDYMEETIR